VGKNVQKKKIQLLIKIALLSSVSYGITVIYDISVIERAVFRDSYKVNTWVIYLINNV
jgi:hypothetical protein